MHNAMFMTVGLAVLFAGRVGVASAPFGGDDTGFVPPDQVTAKCEDGVAKLLANLVGKSAGCLRKSATAAFKGKAFDVDACDDAVEAKFAAGLGKLTCPPCIQPADVLHELATSTVEGVSPLIYCAGSVPLGEDGDLVPPDKATAKCEDGLAKALTKLGRSILKCHIKAADAGLANESFDEEACEDAAQSKYDFAAAKLQDCPPCFNPGPIASMTRSHLDNANGMIYCAF